MASAKAPAIEQLAIEDRPRRIWPTGRDWILFAVQVVLVSMIEVGDDIVRGNLFPPNTLEALHNARLVANFEAAHGFFVEPAFQAFFEQAHDVFGVMLTWSVITGVANNVYAICHIVVTLAVVLWIYVDHRPRFSLVRNVFILTNFVALLGYETFPMAPPRLTVGLMYDHRVVHFQDTMRHIIGTGKLNGSPIGYNPLSAMPSLHVAWALIVGATLLFAARRPLLRAAGVAYPAIMIFAVVVTANHYVMDAVGAVLAVVIAASLALVIERVHCSWRHQHALHGDDCPFVRKQASRQAA